MSARTTVAILIAAELIVGAAGATDKTSSPEVKIAQLLDTYTLKAGAAASAVVLKIASVEPPVRGFARLDATTGRARIELRSKGGDTSVVGFAVDPDGRFGVRTTCSAWVRVQGHYECPTATLSRNQDLYIVFPSGFSTATTSMLTSTLR